MKRTANRFLSLDVVRGIAIFAMTCFHAVENTFNSKEAEKVNPGAANPSPISIILVLTVGIMGMWRAFFLMISATVNMYSMDRSIKSGKNPRKILVKNVFLGGVIWLLGYLREGVFSHFGFLGQSYVNGRLIPEALSMIFVFDTLQMIGASNVISAIIHYFLTRNGGVNRSRRNMIIYGVGAAVIAGTEPLVHDWVNSLYGGSFANVQFAPLSGPAELPSRLFFSAIAGITEPIFPFLATSFIGNVIGIYLNTDRPSKKMLKTGAYTGLGMMALGLLLFALGGFHFDIRGVQPQWFYIYNTGTQLITFMFAFWIGEFREKTNLRGWFKYTVWLRRWGMVSLTVYFFQIYDFVPREIAYRLTGLPFNRMGAVPLWASLTMMVLVVLVWDFTIRAWERIGFKGTMEWFLLMLGKWTIGIEVDKNDPLNVNGILYHPRLINFTDPPRPYGYLQEETIYAGLRTEQEMA